jgi:hypothetical protein
MNVEERVVFVEAQVCRLVADEGDVDILLKSQIIADFLSNNNKKKRLQI